MSPRILFVDHAAVMGGAEISLLDIAAELPGCHTVVLFEEGPFRQALESRGIDYHLLRAPRALLDVSRSGSLINDVAALPAMAVQAIRVSRIARRYDLIYANSQKAFVVCTIAAFLSRKPLLWHLRDILSDEHFSRGKIRRMTHLANMFAQSVVPNSEETARAFILAGGRADLVRVVYNGIDPGVFDAVEDESVRRVRTEFGLEGKTVVGVFGRLSPWKGQHVLLEALIRLPDVHALVVGGPLFREDTEYEQHLRSIVNQNGLASRVRFTGFRTDVPVLLKAVDVVVHTSTAPEPFGRVVVEGMLAGRPVVATNSGGIRELVRDGETGLLFPPGNSRGLADAIRIILESPSTSADFTARARVRAQTEFSLSTMITRLQEHICRLLT